MLNRTATPTQEKGASDLRLRIAQLREQLTETTAAYRQAAARHDSARAIPLLRSRSSLMRQLLDTQCELLLAFRSNEGSRETEPAQASPHQNPITFASP